MKRKALGKGLSALLPDPEPAAAPAAAEPTSEAPVASLEPNPFQPRSANYERVRGNIWDWSSDPDPTTQSTRTVDIPAQDAEIPDLQTVE